MNAVNNGAPSEPPVTDNVVGTPGHETGFVVALAAVGAVERIFEIVIEIEAQVVVLQVPSALT